MVKHLLQDPVRESRMRQRGQAAFRDALSYSKGHGLVSALLTEMDKQASVQNGSQLPANGLQGLAHSPVADPEAASAHDYEVDDVHEMSFLQSRTVLMSCDHPGWQFQHQWQESQG